MSGQQSPVGAESSKSETVEASNAKPYSVEDGDRLWRDIQVQTGFDSYEDYLETSMHREYHHDLGVLRSWIDEQTSPNSMDTCYIVDVIAHEDSPPTLSLRCLTHGVELLSALRQPPEHVYTQVVIWSTGLRMFKRNLDILGLGLRIGPQFFIALIDTFMGPQRSNFHDCAVETRPFRPSHVVIDRTVATFVRHYPFNKPAAAPIVLIAGDIDLWRSVSSASLSDFACVAAQRINNSPPFTNPHHHHGDFASRGGLLTLNLKWLHFYGEINTYLVKIEVDKARLYKDYIN